jgi:parallel beta-helix repeat protein
MKPFQKLLLRAVGLFGGLLLGTQPLLANPSTVQVGTCLHGVTSFPAISKAVVGVAPGGTVYVCPGTYAEQVNIFTPLTLKGVISGNSGRAIITVPSCCLASNVDSIFGDPIVAQVLADAAGTVNISNITVDGAGNNQNNLVDVVGIFYARGTSGTVSGVTTLLQSGNRRGYGIWAENGNGRLESVTIENCDIRDVDSGGIFVGSNQRPPTLMATVKGNMIAVGGAGGGAGLGYSIYDKAAGSVTNNIIANGAISAGNAVSNSVLNNTITGGPIVVAQFGATVKFNTLFESVSDGIDVRSSNATVESNTIVGAAQSGINLFCHTGNTVSGNTISDTLVGVTLVPSSQTVTNTYYNVEFVREGGC